MTTFTISIRNGEHGWEVWTRTSVVCSVHRYVERMLRDVGRKARTTREVRMRCLRGLSTYWNKRSSVGSASRAWRCFVSPPSYGQPPLSYGCVESKYNELLAIPTSWEDWCRSPVESVLWGCVGFDKNVNQHYCRPALINYKQHIFVSRADMKVEEFTENSSSLPVVLLELISCIHRKNSLFKI